MSSLKVRLIELFDKDIDSIKKMSEEDRLKLVVNYVKSNISYQGLNKNMERPLLRASAEETLECGKGFCGDYVRVAIRLLDIVGIKARRFYLFGHDNWEHVIFECQINEKWYLVNMIHGHGKEIYGNNGEKIESPEFKLMGDEFNDNPWVDYHRIRFFHNISFLNGIKDFKLPHFLVVFFESPSLIKAVSSLLVLFIFVFFSRIFSGIAANS